MGGPGKVPDRLTRLAVPLTLWTPSGDLRPRPWPTDKRLGILLKLLKVAGIVFDPCPGYSAVAAVLGTLIGARFSPEGLPKSGRKTVSKPNSGRKAQTR